ncbi:MAG: hypothetical protein H6819_13055 [Phycisphaerales bacterium]|nr:hypothetical protein [Phycisphaerales bacterium]MCB9854435.1 hypothetical protein [Phycisphaerales bacterium]
MHRRAVRSCNYLTAVSAVTFCSLSPLIAQTAQYSSTFDATSVGYVPSAAGYGWGGYPYRRSNAAPAGEFGGYLYRSPDDFVNYRGPVYVPIAGAQFGMPVADASGHVSLEDVPMWTDEWAARIIQNRAAAGLAVESLTPADASPPPSHFRTRFESIEETGEHAAPKRMEPMRQVPSVQSTTAKPPEVVQPIASPPNPPPPTHELIVPEKPIAEAPKHEPSKTLVLTAPESVDSMSVGKTGVVDAAVPTSQRDITTEAAELPPSKDPAVARILQEDPAQGDAVADTAVSNAAAAREEPPPDHDGAFAIKVGEPTAPARTAAADAPKPAAAPGLTREDLNRATAAGIAIGRGDKAFEQGEYEQARDEYRHAIDVAGDAAGIRIALGLSDYALGSFDEAAHAIRRGVSRSPELAKSDFRLLDVYGRADDSNVHRHQLDEFVTNNPENADALFLLGFVQYFSDQREAARTTFGAYRSIVPHDDLADSFIEIVLNGRPDVSGQ